jgi:GntR family transcriptional regulator / MocR family aminotransferase
MKQLILSDWLLRHLTQHAFPTRMPNHRRVYEAIRRAITEQVLPSGSRLPSTRNLATDLSVSRNTILAAFDQLLDEGYVAAKTGSGTYVVYKQTDGFVKNLTVNMPLESTSTHELSKRGLAASDSPDIQSNSQYNES